MSEREAGAASPASSERERKSPSLVASASTGVGLATLCALVAVLPATLRVSGSLAFATAFIGLWGSAALMLGPTAAALRVARPLPPMAWCLPLGLSLSLAPLSLFARVLIVATHHRPLGGATFAFVAAGVIAVAVAVAARVISWSLAKPGSARRFVPLGLGVLGALAGAVMLLPALSSPLRASVLDGALVLAACLVAALVRVPGRLARSLERAGVGLWVVVAVLGLLVGLSTPEARAALDAKAPVLLALAGWLRG